jgi:tetratricopeptide (TPR) repeat protein
MASKRDMLLCMRNGLIAAAMYFAVGLFVSLPCIAQQSKDWGKLLDAKKSKQARALCVGWTQSKSLATRVDAEKCLANVELYEGQSLSLIGDDAGGGTLGSGYTSEAVDKALVHLNKGIQLAPQDISLHLGRLHILEVSGRFTAMNQALEESANLYHGPDALHDWLPYEGELADMRQARAGLEFAEVLNLLYPNSHEVIGNIGAFHNMLKEYDKALPYIQQAQVLSPQDPIDTWNLGWTYEQLGNTEEANKWLSKAIEIDPVGKDEPDRNCLYAEFVEKKLHDTQRACTLEKISCEADRQTACAKPESSQKATDSKSVPAAK